MSQKSSPIHPGVRIGHVHLKVADLDRALAFYRDVLGFELTQRYGRQAAFLSAGGYHHHIGLNTWKVGVVRRRHTVTPVFTISPSCTPPELSWPMPCAD